MSTMTAARVTPRPARHDGRADRPRLRLVHAAPLPQSNTGFVVLCLALVVAGLLTALLLNTQRAESSFVVSDLRNQATLLHDQRVTLQAELAQQRSPDALAARAARLGMVPSPSTAVLRLSDGAVLGVAAGIEDGETFTVVTTGPQTDLEPTEHAGSEAGSGSGR